MTETLNFPAPPDNTEINVRLNSVVTLYTNPWGAAVKINGELIGTTTYKGLTIPWDKGKISVEKQGFKSETFTFETSPSEEQYFIELEQRLEPVTERLNWPSPSSESMSVLHKFWARVISGIRAIPTASDIKVLGYSLAGLLVVSLGVVLVSGLIGRPGIEKQHADMSSQLQLKDAEITRLTQEKLEEQRLRKNFEKQLSDANTELMKKSQEISRLKTAQTAAPPPPKQIDLSPTNRDLILWASTGNNTEVSRLLAQGAHTDAKDSFGFTALMKASANGHSEVVKTLLMMGADKNLKSLSGYTALDYAKQYNHTSLLPLLR